jgi:hypothetical protein
MPKGVMDGRGVHSLCMDFQRIEWMRDDGMEGNNNKEEYEYHFKDWILGLVLSLNVMCFFLSERDCGKGIKISFRDCTGAIQCFYIPRLLD